MPSTKEVIETEAINLFAENGFEGTSMRKIADRVGVSEPAIYRHFKSKHDLGRRIFRENYAQLARTIRVSSADAEDAESALVGAVEIFCDYYDADQNLFRYLLTIQHRFLGDEIPDDENVTHVFSNIVEAYLLQIGVDPIKKIIATSIAMGIIIQPSIFHLYGRFDSSLGAIKADITTACVAALRAI